MPSPAPAERSSAHSAGDVRPRALETPLLVLALVLLTWAAVAWLTGGFSYEAGPVRISSRDPVRPLLAGLACAALLLRLAPWASINRSASRLWQMVGRFAPFGATGTAAFVFWLGLAYGTHVAGGSDSYGYVSQADLWSRGQLSIDLSSLAPLPWPQAEWSLSPLGYRPWTVPYHIVPTYAPGLPMLMAVSKLSFGPAAVYWVVPLCAALAVWLTYVLGRQLDDVHTGLLGAILLAASPAFLYQTMSPMSDVPVTTFWLLALVCANSSRRSAAAMSGLAAAVAVLIRPNLVPLAVVPAWWIMARVRGRGARPVFLALASYAATLLPGPLVVAGLNEYWYGSPLQSGYGNVEGLYAVARLWPNLRLYSGWLIETQSLFVVLAVVPFLGAQWRRRGTSLDDRHIRVGIAAFTAVLLASYLFYLVFEYWWYLRFLLPLYPLLTVLSAAGLLAALRRVRVMEIVSLLIVVPLVVWLVQAGASRAVFELRRYEQRYVRVGRELGQTLPERAVVFAMQHSGSIRHYGNRLTLRYDFLPPDTLDRAVKYLHSRGMPAYALLEEWEEPSFVRRFGRHTCRGTLRWGAARQWHDTLKIRLYDLSVPECE